MCFSFLFLQNRSIFCASRCSGQPTKQHTPVGRSLLRQNERSCCTSLRSGQPIEQETLVDSHIFTARRQKMLSMGYSQRGFTLLEIIIGIVALSISLAVVSSFIAPAEQQSADQIHQIKAAELGQGMLDEILGRAFDENSDMVGSHWRCGETGHSVCSTTLAAENNEFTSSKPDRNKFDDVDDYNGFSESVNSTNISLGDSFSSFQINVSVAYAGSELGLSNNNLAKRITVTVTTPLGTPINFTGYKANF